MISVEVASRLNSAAYHAGTYLPLQEPLASGMQCLTYLPSPLRAMSPSPKCPPPLPYLTASPTNPDYLPRFYKYAKNIRHIGQTTGDKII